MPIDDSYCQLAAIGSKSLQALEGAGLNVSIQPSGLDSESLLQHTRLQANAINTKSIVIFRGEDGRDILGDELSARGATVNYAAVYARKRPVHARPLNTETIQSLDAVTISSNEGLSNIVDMVKEAAIDLDKLLTVPVFVPGKRAQELARCIGFKHIIVAANATDDAMLTALRDNL